MPTFRVVFEADMRFEAASEEETEKELIFRDSQGRIIRRFAKGIVCAHWVESQSGKDDITEEAS